MALRSIYHFSENELTKTGRSIGAIIHSRLWAAILKALKELGTDAFRTNSDIYNFLKSRVNLKEPDLTKVGIGTEFEYRLKWGLNQLKNAELVEKNPNEYLSWKITEKGLQFLNENGLSTTDEIENDSFYNVIKIIDNLVLLNKSKTHKDTRYWAGGFGRGAQFYARLEDFIENNYWQALDYDEDSNQDAANKALSLFDEIEVGDLFLIKGYGGSNDLVVHYLGKVINKIEDEGKLEFEPISKNKVNIKGPTGKGSGNWRDTLLEITRPEDIQLLFHKNNSQEQKENTLMAKEQLFKSKNIILYGPPGTGKTYTLQNKYFDKFTTKAATLTKEQYFINKINNYSWWQVIGAALLDLKKAKVSEIEKHDLISYKKAVSDSSTVKPTLWAQLQAHTVPECEFVKVTRKMAPFLFNKTENSEWEFVGDVNEEVPEIQELLNEYKNFNPKSGEDIKRYKFLTFHQSYSYEEFIEGIKPILSQDSTAQELNYEITKGVFKDICEIASKDLQNEYAIFIDEINRGNISNIFGELITLIEDDKRVGAQYGMKAILPYSKSEFGVPNNLYIIGTMNTADRSVEALDTALRRRFSFKEMLPDYTLLQTSKIYGRLWDANTSGGWGADWKIKENNFFELFGGKRIADEKEYRKLENIDWDEWDNAINSEKYVIFNGIELNVLLQTINDRICVLLSTDHVIGHSYFINCYSLENLKHTIYKNIIPLLQEYFYGDYGKIGLVLGSGFVKIKIDEKAKVNFADFKYEQSEDLQKMVYEIVPEDKIDIKDAIAKLLNIKVTTPKANEE